MSTSMLGASKRDMSGAPSRVKGRLLFSKHGNGKETTRDSSNQVLSTSLTTSPQTHHHQQHRRGLQENTTRLKATLLAVIAAAVMGGFTVASSELTNITPPGVSAVSLSAADRGRYSEQQLGSGTAASHGQPGLGNVYRPPVAGHTVERAAWEQPHEFIETSSKVSCREYLPSVGSGISAVGWAGVQMYCREVKPYYLDDNTMRTVQTVYLQLSRAFIQVRRAMRQF